MSRYNTLTLSLVALVLSAFVWGLSSCGGGGGNSGAPVVKITPGDNSSPVVERTFDNVALSLESSGQAEWRSDEIAVYFSDPDGDSLAFEAESSSADVAEVTFAREALEVRATGGGTTTVTVTATDPGGLSALQSFTVTVSYGTGETPADHSDTPEGAVSIASGETVRGDLHSPDDVDWFALEITDLSAVEIQFFAPAGTEISVLDLDSNVLDSRVTQSPVKIVTIVLKKVLIRVTPKIDKLPGGKVAYRFIAKKVSVVTKFIRNQLPISVTPAGTEISTNLKEFLSCELFRRDNNEAIDYERCEASVEVAQDVLVSVRGKKALTFSVTAGGKLQRAMLCQANSGRVSFPVSVIISIPRKSLPIEVGRFEFEWMDEIGKADAEKCRPKKEDDRELSFSASPGESVFIALNDYIKDPREGLLTFTHKSVPSTLGIEQNGSDWTIRVSPDAEDGETSMVVTATSTKDGTDLSADFSLRVSVESGPRLRDDAPPLDIVIPWGDQATIVLTDYIEDPEGGRLTFAPVAVPPGFGVQRNGPDWTVLAPSSTATAREVVRDELTVTATAANGRSADFGFRVLVTGPRRIQRAPPLSVSLPAGDAAAITLTDHIEDPLGGELTFTRGTTPRGLRVITNGPSWEFEASEDMEPGSYSITVTATESNGISGDFSLKVIVEEFEELGPEWIQAENVDCHAHRDTLRNLAIWRNDTAAVAPYTYSGQCRERKAHGRGTAVRLRAGAADHWEARYEGDWNDGRATGRGTIIHQFPNRPGVTDRNHYEGEILDGLPHGQGTRTSVDLDDPNPAGPDFRYEGQWRHGQRHGQGVETATGYSRYEGSWRNDLEHGQGTMTLHGPFFGDRYSGEWNSGNFLNGSVTKNVGGCRYEGRFRDGCGILRGGETCPSEFRERRFCWP